MERDLPISLNSFSCSMLNASSLLTLNRSNSCRLVSFPI
uniref:Uncharacterized protein n=1 Tax=Arundo donax TaxID=35708 RepID=A0A0A8Z945_ARUDO